MSQPKMRDSSADAGDGWHALSRRLPAPEPVSDVDVARLRARVRGAMPERSHRFAWRVFQGAALAASVAVAFFAVLQGSPTETRTAAAPEVVRTEDGSVVIRFADDRSTHRVLESDAPQAVAPAQVHVARGKQFVDKPEQAQPGSITFYRID